MARLEDLNPLDGAARSYAARVLRESRIHTTKDGQPITLSSGFTAETTDWDAIFSAEAELIAQLPPEVLKRRAPQVYDRYADVAGAEQAARRAANALDLSQCTEEELRADLLQVHNETARHYMTAFQVERERTRLAWLVVTIGGAALVGLVAFIGWPFVEYGIGPRWGIAAYAAGLLLILLVTAGFRRFRARRDTAAMAAGMAVGVALLLAGEVGAQVTRPAVPAKQFMDLPIIPLVIFAGVLGATFSILQRVQRSTAADPLIALFNLRAARSQIYLSIVSGAIASLVVFAVFSGGMLEGGLFPRIANANSPQQCQGVMKLVKYLQATGPCTHTDYGKLVVWAFIAGFAERFVPDILDRFTATSKK